MNDNVLLESCNDFSYFEEIGHIFVSSNADLNKCYSEFTPVRFMHKDILLAATVARKQRSRFEVALILDYNVSGVKMFEGVRAALTHLLAQAYSMTGKPEIHFVEIESLDSFPKVSTHPVSMPRRVAKALYYLGLIDARGISASSINAELGRSILLHYAQLDPVLCQQLVELHIEPLRVAIQIFRDVWTISDVKLFIQHCLDPRAIIAGVLDPQRKGFSFGDLAVAQLSVMHQRLRVMFDEQDVVQMEIEFDWDEDATLHFTTVERHVVSTCFSGEIHIAPGTKVMAVFFPHDVAGFCFLRSCLLKRVKELVDNCDPEILILLVTTADFRLLPVEERTMWEADTALENLEVVSIVDTRVDLLREVESRLKQSRIWASALDSMADS